ncbi:hypothetical protein G6F32_015009 [Rhizopus arrhizus]|nr:hypothetical protein G6F32_015009 [Rhizopus arrhizus]
MTRLSAAELAARRDTPDGRVFDVRHDLTNHAAGRQAYDAGHIPGARHLDHETELAAPRTLHIATAGGASLTLEGGNLVVNCPGTITVHAGQKSFVGPAQLSYALPDMPTSTLSEQIPKLAFRLQDIPGPQGHPLAGQPWKIVPWTTPCARRSGTMPAGSRGGCSWCMAST